MRRPVTRHKLFLAASALAVTLTGCSSPASREGMIPPDLAIGTYFPHSLGIQTGGGASTGAMDTSNISDEDLKAAIEEAVIQNKLFKSIVQGKGGDYELSVRLTTLSKPILGGTISVEMEMAWSLTKAADRSVVMRKSVKSSASKTMGDAFAFVTRLRLAVETATRDNIGQGLKAIAELKL